MDPSLGPRFLFAALPAPIIFTARGIVGFGNWIRPRSGNSQSRRAAEVLAGIVAAVLILVGTMPYHTRLARAGIPEWRRAARAALHEIEGRGIHSGTVFIRSSDVFTMIPGFQLVSGFDERASLVFARDRGTRENKRLIEARGGGPAYYLEPDMVQRRWILDDRSYRDRLGIPSEGLPGPALRRKREQERANRSDSSQGASPR